MGGGIHYRDVIERRFDRAVRPMPCVYLCIYVCRDSVTSVLYAPHAMDDVAYRGGEGGHLAMAALRSKLGRCHAAAPLGLACAEALTLRTTNMVGHGFSASAGSIFGGRGNENRAAACHALALPVFRGLGK